MQQHPDLYLLLYYYRLSQLWIHTYQIAAYSSHIPYGILSCLYYSQSLEHCINKETLRKSVQPFVINQFSQAPSPVDLPRTILFMLTMITGLIRLNHRMWCYFSCWGNNSITISLSFAETRAFPIANQYSPGSPLRWVIKIISSSALKWYNALLYFCKNLI